jgi:predicted amidohydrolase
MKALRIALVQMELAWEQEEENLSRAEELLTANPGADLYVLPEMFSTGFSMRPEQFAVSMDGQAVQRMKDWAARLDAAVAGSLMMRQKDGFVNRFLFVLPDGSLEYYDKKHLFSLGSEHRHYQPGNTQTIVEWRDWRIALYVCYDLRFPEWCRNRNDAHLALFTANWPDTRIKHWDILLPARAVENQLFVAGVNRVGLDGNGVAHSGHSALYDYSGITLCRAQDGEETVLTASLDPDALKLYRRQLPFLKDAHAFHFATE